MRTTVTIDDKLLADAQKATGVVEKSVLLRMGLESLVQREAGRRLIALGGSDPDAWIPPRRRPADHEDDFS